MLACCRRYDPVNTENYIYILYSFRKYIYVEKGILGVGVRGRCPLEANDIYYYLSLNTDTLITFLSFVVIVALLYLSCMSSVMNLR